MATFPQPLAPKSLQIVSNTPTLVSTAQNLQRQVRSRGAHRWLITANWPVLKRSEWAQMYGFAQAQRGQFNTFQFVLPGQLSTPQGVATGTPVVSGAGQTGRSVVTSGWTANVAGILRAGDFIKFAGNKVYMLTADAASNATGVATLTIEPALSVSPANGETVQVSAVPFTVAFAGDTQSSNVAEGGYYDFTASMLEVP